MLFVHACTRIEFVSVSAAVAAAYSSHTHASREGLAKLCIVALSGDLCQHHAYRGCRNLTLTLTLALTLNQNLNLNPKLNPNRGRVLP